MRYSLIKIVYSSKVKNLNLIMKSYAAFRLVFSMLLIRIGVNIWMALPLKFDLTGDWLVVKSNLIVSVVVFLQTSNRYWALKPISKFSVAVPLTLPGTASAPSPRSRLTVVITNTSAGIFNAHFRVLNLFLADFAITKIGLWSFRVFHGGGQWKKLYSHRVVLFSGNLGIVRR